MRTRTIRQSRFSPGHLFGALAAACLLLAAMCLGTVSLGSVASAAADEEPPVPGDSSHLSPPPLPAPVVKPGDAGAPPGADPVDLPAAPPVAVGSDDADTEDADTEGADTGDADTGDADTGDADTGGPETADRKPGDAGVAASAANGPVADGPPPGDLPPPQLVDVTTVQPSDIVVQAEPPARRRRLQRLPIEGSFRMDYRGRWDDDESDHDLYQYLVLSVGDQQAPGWSFSFHGRLTEDLDGRSDKSEFFVFDSITDTYKHRVNGRVYNMYATYRPRGGSVKMVRIGRQWVEGGELLHVDGLRIDFGSRNPAATFGATLYGGLPAHLFEGSPEGDAVVGFGVHGRPWAGAEARFDYVYLNDESRYYGSETAHLLTLYLRQRVSRHVSWWGTYQHLDEDPRTLRLAATGSIPEQDFLVRGSFYSQLTTQKERVTDIDPYFAVAQTLEAYWTGDLSASKGIGERLYVEGGVALRRLWDEGDEGIYNREFTRYWLAGSLDGWPGRDMNITLTGERWDSQDDAWTVTADFEYRPSKRFKFQMGTDYSAYRFDLYTADERQSVRGYYVRMVVRTSDRWRIHLRLRVEDDKFDTYVMLNTGFEVEL